MSALLPVLAGPDEVTDEEQRFRCGRLSATVTGILCATRHTATRHVVAGRREAVYLGCALCPDGARLHARLQGLPLPAPRGPVWMGKLPAELRPDPPRPTVGAPTEGAPCAVEGCGHLVTPWMEKLPVELRALCGDHRHSARRVEQRLSVGTAEAVALVVARQVPRRSAWKPVDEVCGVKGCDRPRGHVTRKTRTGEEALCSYHRERMRSLVRDFGVDFADALRRLERAA